MRWLLRKPWPIVVEKKLLGRVQVDCEMEPSYYNPSQSFLNKMNTTIIVVRRGCVKLSIESERLSKVVPHMIHLGCFYIFPFVQPPCMAPPLVVVHKKFIFNPPIELDSQIISSILGPDFYFLSDYYFNPRHRKHDCQQPR